MALKKSELYSFLWQSCDELRGGMDANQYKDYVLVLLFVKYVNHRYSSEHGSGRKDAPLHSSPAEHKKGQGIFFCCVTTRPDSAPASVPQTVAPRGRPRRDDCTGHAARAVRARLPHAFGELPAADAVVAAASRPANGVPVSGRSGLGSSVGSSAEPDRSCDTLGAGKSANRGDGRSPLVYTRLVSQPSGSSFPLAALPPVRHRPK